MNSDMLKMQLQMLKNTPTEQLNQMPQFQGMSPDMIKNYVNMIENMSDDDMNNFLGMTNKLAKDQNNPLRPQQPNNNANSGNMAVMADDNVLKTLKIAGNFLKEKMPGKAIKYYLEARSDLEKKGQKEDKLTASRIALGLAEAYFQKNEYDSTIEESKNCEHEKSKGWGFYWRSRACIEQKKTDQAKVFAKKSYEMLGNSSKSIKKQIRDLKLDNIIKDSVVVGSQTNSKTSSFNTNNNNSTHTMPQKLSQSMPNLYEDKEKNSQAGDETAIFEDKKRSDSNISPSFGGPAPDLNNMGQGQLDYMSSMLKTEQGRKMMKDIYQNQLGMNMTDEQQSMMSGMMTPDTIKMGMNMQNNLKQQGVDTSNLKEVQNATKNMNLPNMPTGMGNMMGSNPNLPANPQNLDSTGQPQMPDMGGMDGLLNNPEMINNMFDMVKGNPGMIRNMIGMAPDAQGAGWLANASDESLTRMVTWVQRLYKVGRPCWPVLKNIWYYKKYIGLLIVAYFFKRWFL